MPKSRGDFAEFLQRDSLLRLSYLNQFTCVGFSTVFLLLFVVRRKREVVGVFSW